MKQERGRPRTADPTLRDNNYRDENGRYQLTELKPWHERIVDFMLMNPGAKKVDIARAFDVSPQWVGQLTMSDSFIEYYRSRVGRHEELVHTQTITQLQSVATKALGRISEHLDSKDVSFGAAKEAASLALKSLKYIDDGGQGVSIRTNGGQVVVAVTSDVVARAREKMKQRAEEASRTIEHDPDAYQQVTSSMSIRQEDIPDAIEISRDE